MAAKPIVYNPRQVRLFLVLAAALGAWLLYRNAAPRLRVAFWAAEGAVLLLFLAAPKLFFPAYKVILAASGRLGALIFDVLSFLIYFLVLTPIAAVMRLFGKRFMETRPRDAAAASYYGEGAGNSGYDRQY